MLRRPLSVAIPLFSLLLSACGSGDGGPAGPGVTSDEVTDREAAVGTPDASDTPELSEGDAEPVLTVDPESDAVQALIHEIGNTPIEANSTLPCRAELSPTELSELAWRSDPALNRDLETAHENVLRIGDILVSHRDYRGTFLLFYRNILSSAVPALTNGQFENPVWARRVTFEFVYRFLDNFHRHITGRDPIEPWKNFYRRAAECNRSVGRTVMSALTAHLVIDFPESLRDAGSTLDNQDDYFLFGDLLVVVTPNIADDVERYYGYNLRPFFRLWFLSDLANPVLGDDVVTYYMFQSIRGIAWNNGIALRSPLARPGVRASMLATWGAAEAGLDGFAALGLL